MTKMPVTLLMCSMLLAVAMPSEAERVRRESVAADARGHAPEQPTADETCACPGRTNPLQPPLGRSVKALLAAQKGFGPEVAETAPKLSDSELATAGVTGSDRNTCDGQTPRRPCEIGVYFWSLEHVNGPALDKNGEFATYVTLAGDDTRVPQSGFSKIYEGSSKTYQALLQTFMVPCGETRTIPYRIKVNELDNYLIVWAWDVGEVSGSLDLTCPPSGPAEIVDHRIPLEHKNGNVRHEVDAQIRAIPHNPSSICQPVSPGSGGHCDVSIDVVSAHVAGLTYGYHAFTLSVGNDTVRFPNDPQDDYLQVNEDWEAIEQTAFTHSLDCGTERRIDLEIDAAAVGYGNYHTGASKIPLTVGCPLGGKEFRVDVPLSGGYKRLQLVLALRDHHWSKYNEPGLNCLCECDLFPCSTDCDPCPWIGQFDGANCWVGEPPDGATPLILGNAFYFDPPASTPNLCPSAIFVEGHCFDRSIPPQAKPFLWNGNYYVRNACIGSGW